LTPQSNTDTVADVAIAAGKIVAIGKAPAGFSGCRKPLMPKAVLVMPGFG
jgi:dihydroorotase